jgi:hypothetical protein
VTYSTLQRRLWEAGINYRHYISDEELREVIAEEGFPTENGNNRQALGFTWKVSTEMEVLQKNAD